VAALAITLGIEAIGDGADDDLARA